MANFNVADAKRTPQIVIRDGKGDVASVITPKDFQVGFEGSPGALILRGALDINALIVNVKSANDKTIRVSNDRIAYFIVNTSGLDVDVLLPTPPTNAGQLHIIKDFGGTANNPTPKITVNTSDGSLIDNVAGGQSISVAYGACMFVWTGNSWCALPLGASGAGGGAPNSSKFVVWGTESSLTNSRVVQGVIGQVDVTNDGTNVNIGLTSISTAGTYNYPTFVTIDAKGRVTALNSGPPPGGDPNASFVVLANTASLPNERALTAGTAIRIDDGGPNAAVTINVDDNYVAMVSGTTFRGPQTFNAGLTGSLQLMTNGLSYLQGGANVTITTQSNGQVLISSTASGSAGVQGADPLASFLLMTPTSSLVNNRQFSTGVGIHLQDTGPGGSATISVNDNFFAALTGSIFTGPVQFKAALTGTLQQLVDGTSYLAQGPNITITSGANGQIVISSTATITASVDAADREASYVVIATTSSLPNERALTPGTGIRLQDGGPNTGVTMSIDNNVVATVSGTTFTGPVKANSGFTGSLHILTDNRSFIAAGQNVTIVSASNGQITISAATTITGAADPLASYVVIANTSSLPNERALAVGTGLRSVDGGANSSVTLSINDNVVATISGSTFSGPVKFNGGLSGSLQNTVAGLSYLQAGPNIIITTGSNGQITIESSATITASLDAADRNASYVVMALTTSLPNERAVAAGTGIKIFDSGANGNVVFSINDTVVATVSGTTFTGIVNLNAGASGSITRLTNGSSYLVAGQNILISSVSNGQITISSINNTDYFTGTWRDPGNTFVTTGSVSIDGSNRTAAQIGSDVFFFVSGSQGVLTGANRKVTVLGGDTYSSGSIIASTGLTGSLQQTAGGLSYLVAGDNVGIVTASNGQITISAATGGNADMDRDPSFLVLSFTGSLNRERVLNVSGNTGLKIVDNGPGSYVTMSIDNNVVATVSGTRFSGPVRADAGLTGSIFTLPNGLSYLVAGNNAFITSGANGQITISGPSTTGGGADANATYLVISNTASLNAERAVTAGTGIKITDGGANALITFAIDDNRVATITGSAFSGPVRANAGLTGSLQLLTDGRSYLAAGPLIKITSSSNGQVTVFASDSQVATISGSNFTGFVKFQAGLTGSLQLLTDGRSYLQAGQNVIITSASNGQIIISAVTGSGGGTGDNLPSYIVVSATGSLANERILTAGPGISIYDAGPGANITVSLANLLTSSNRIDPDADDIIVWQLSEPSGPTLYNYGTSGSLADLTTSSGLVYGRAGIFSSSIDFRGQFPPSFASASNAVTPRDLGFTVSSWIYLYQYMSGNVVTKNLTTGSYDPRSPIILGVTGAFGNPFVQLRTTVNTTNLMVVEDSRSVDFYAWNHFGFTVSGTEATGTVRFYLNGDFVKTMTITGSIDYGSNGWWSVGGRPDGAEAGDYKLNDVRIANVVRDDGWWRDTFIKATRGVNLSPASASVVTASNYLTKGITGSYYMVDTDQIIYSSGLTGSIIVFTPQITSPVGKSFKIKAFTGNDIVCNIIISGSGDDRLDGQETFTLANNYGTVEIIKLVGTSWGVF